MLLMLAISGPISGTILSAEAQVAPPTWASAHWSFDSTANDSSGKGNNGAIKGNAHYVTGYLGNGVSLDGDGDYVTVPDSSSLKLTGAFSISAWVKLNTLNPEGHTLRILEKGSSPGEKYWMFFVKSTKKFGFGFINSENDVQIRSSKTDWKAGQWYHIVGTYNPEETSNNMKLYVNGVLDTQATKTGTPSTNTKPLVIGTRSTADWEFWNGDIDEVRIYSRALTAKETTNLYESAHRVTSTVCASACDYSNLQTAINSLPSGGGKILIKDGEYTTANTIQLKSSTTLEFSENAVVIFQGSSKPLFKGTNLNNVIIRGGQLVAEFGGAKAIAFWDSTKVTVDGTNVRLTKGSESNAFYCIDCTNVFVLNLNAQSATRLVDIKTDSRVNDGLSKNIWVQNGIITDTSVEGIRVNYSTDVHIIGNTVTNTLDNGIDIGWNKNTEMRKNRLTDASDPNGSGIHTDSAIGGVISDNYVDGTGKAGITVFRASGLTITENTIVNAGGSGIDVITSTAPSSNIKIISNSIISPAEHGIYVSPLQSNIQVTDNTIDDLLSGKKGVYVNTPNSSTTISGNKVL
jgi:parallel beta-helix repeat protein